ncbi:MAG TPA: sugar kinase [Ruminococcaceae bacterium]|jgi:predicted NBD/HSP70 family sugar kinase|nr:sugar kinase [Oscillospiraceae bacterium]
MNNLEVRNTNKKRIVNFLYANTKATKQDIAKSLNLSTPTVSLILKKLFAQGLVKKSGVLQSSGGRKPTAISLVYNAKMSAGIEITQNHLRFVIIDLSGHVLHYKKIREPFQNDNKYFGKVADSLELFFEENSIDPASILGVGIALPGVVDVKNGMLEYSPTLGVKNLPLEVLTSYFPYATMANNEANLAGFAEIWTIDSIDNAIFLSVNKGVGGAIIIGNKLYNGCNGRAGEFGHMTIVKDGLTCSCGKKGCFEAYCSTKVLTEPNFNDIDDFFGAISTGDKYCIEKWKTYLGYLSTGINNIHTIFDSDIIIGGEISQYIQQSSEFLNRNLSYANSFDRQYDYIRFSKYGDKASTVGAALLFVDSFLNE